MNTYRYIYPLRKISFKLREKPYPKYSKGKEYLPEYRHNIRLIYRAFCLAYVLGFIGDFEVLKKWILNNQTSDEIQDNMKLALSNRYILERVGKNGLQRKTDEICRIFIK